METFEFDGCWFSTDAADNATLVTDASGNGIWRVPCGNGFYETTDEGMRMLREAARVATQVA